MCIRDRLGIDKERSAASLTGTNCLGRDLDYGLLGVHSKLDDIQDQHGSDEACLKAVVEVFLLGEGRYKQPSWRAVIHALHEASESHLADQIKSYAEPVQGECVWVIMCVPS